MKPLSTETDLRQLIEQEGQIYQERDGQIYASEKWIGMKSALLQCSRDMLRLRVHAVCTETEPEIGLLTQTWFFPGKDDH